MRNSWVILLLTLLLAASVGCAKKQTVRGGNEAAGAAGTAGVGGAAGQGANGGSDAISSETLKGEAGTKTARDGAAGGKNGTGSSASDNRLAMAEAQAGVGATQEKASPFQDILFEFDQSSIRDDAKPILAGIAAYMSKNKVGMLIIEGHCDSRGTAEYNMALGERRAESAKKYLAALGVNTTALQTVSYGKEKPAVQGETEEAWARNRRGHFLVR